MQCKATFDWADDTYTFALRLAQLEELQEKADCGPMQLFSRLQNGTWKFDDFRNIIRLGLIGGGMEPAKALNLIRRYVDDQPIAPQMTPAIVILAAALFGVEDDPPPKPLAPDEEQEPFPSAEMESSDSQPSTEPAQ